IVSESANYLFIQRLTLNAFPTSGTDNTNTVVFIRSYSYLGFSEWERLTGELLYVDAVQSVGDDASFATITVGDTSPKVAFELVRLDITYDNFGYEEDGVTPSNPNYDMRGYAGVQSTRNEIEIISIEGNVFSNLHGAGYVKISELYTY